LAKAGKSNAECRMQNVEQTASKPASSRVLMNRDGYGGQAENR
jgi:hypothetical protein